jgi:hypothetical protein
LVLPNPIGISGKSQILFAVTYATRYVDLFTQYVSLYNSVMKILFIAASIATVYFIFFKFRATYEAANDTFQIIFAFAPAAILALIWNYSFDALEVPRLSLVAHTLNAIACSLIKGGASCPWCAYFL